MALEVLIVGISGKMGRKIYERIKSSPDLQCVGGYDKNKPAFDVDVPVSIDISKLVHLCDVVVDFSLPDATMNVLDSCKQADKGMVIGTTGYSSAQIKKLKDSSKSIPILHSPNMASAIDLLGSFAHLLSSVLPESYDIEIIEKHSKTKKDAPSGTALKLGSDIAKGRNHILTRKARFGRHGDSPRKKGEITFHSVRAGALIAEHEILFIGQHDQVSISHTAFDRMVFVEGALQALKFIHLQKPGWYSMRDCMESDHGL